MNRYVSQGAKALVGIAAAAATLLAFAPAASAAEEQVVLADGTANSTTITVNGTNSALREHQFKAVRLSTYGGATHEGPALKSVNVSSNRSALLTEMTDAYTTVSGEALPSQFQGNPLGAVANKWLGFHSESVAGNSDETSNNHNKAWDGDLRKFVTNLVGTAGFKAELNKATTPVATVTATGADDAAGTAVFSGLPMGMYLVIDTTGDAGNTAVGATNTSAAIPMLVGTKVLGDNTEYDDFGGNGEPSLGVVSLKSDTPIVKKEMISNGSAAKDSSASIGDMLDFRITGSVPLTTGFTYYKYQLTDTPTKGLQFDPESVTVGVYDVNALQTTLVAGTDYTVTAPAAEGDHIVFNLSRGIVKLNPDHYGQTIRVDYKMQVTDQADPANLGNGIMLEYSNDSANQPTDVDGNGGTVGTVDNRDDPDGQVKIHFYGFTLENVAKSDANNKLVGGTFQVVDPNGTTVKFLRDGATGDYKKAANQANTNATADLHPSDGVTRASRAKGQLHVDGLAAGTYKVVQTEVPAGFGAAWKSTFHVTISTDAPNTLEAPAYSNTTDDWSLVTAGTWTAAENATHVIQVREVTSFSQLPMTGGAGVIVAGLTIAVLLMGAGAIYVFTRRGEKALSQEA